MDYRARYYNVYINRFIQADTIVPDPIKSQAANRYMFVGGNPIKFVDPSGHRTCTAEQAATGDETCSQNYENDNGFYDHVYFMWQIMGQNWPYYEYQAAITRALTQASGGTVNFYEMSSSVADSLYQDGGPSWSDIQVATYFLLNADAIIQYGQTQNFVNTVSLLSITTIYAQQNLLAAAGSSSDVPETSYKLNLDDDSAAYEDYWNRHAPEQSTPYSTYRRYTPDGTIKQVTTYDRFGARRVQYDLVDPRIGEHSHWFSPAQPGDRRPKWQRLPTHFPLDYIP